MKNINLSQVNQKYISNKQNSTSNPIEAKQNTEQIKDGNNKMKKALAGLAIAGAVIAAGAGIYKGVIKAKKTIEQITDVTQDGIGKLLKENDKLTGKFQKNMKDGSKVIIEYTDGIIQKSTKTASDGTQIFEKVYSKASNGDLLVNNKNITEISRQARKHQDDFLALMKKKDISLDELQGFDRKNLSKNQIQELDLKINAKQEAIKLEVKKAKELAEQQAKKAEELAKKQAREAQELTAKEAQGRIQEEAVQVADIKDPSLCCSVTTPKYNHKLSSACSIRTENTEDFNGAREYLEELRNYELEYFKRKKDRYCDEAELKFIDEYSRKNLDDIDVIFDGKYGSPTDKLFLLAKNNSQTRGTSLVVHEIPEIFNGLEPRLIEEAINELSHNLYCNAIKIGDKKFGVERIGGGTYNAVLRIFDDSGKNVALRVTQSCNRVRVACEEMVNAINLTKNNIVDVPKFYMGNPLLKRTYNDAASVYDAGCWQLCEYVTKETPMRKGKKLLDYLKEINGRHLDLNSGSFVGDYIVDFGGISGKNMGYCSKLNMDGILNYIAEHPEFELDEILQIINKK